MRLFVAADAFGASFTRSAQVTRCESGTTSDL